MSQHAKQEVNWEFLLNSSKSTLQAYESSRLNFADEPAKGNRAVARAWVDESSNALLARWLIERNLAAEAAAICPSPDRRIRIGSERTQRATRLSCRAACTARRNLPRAGPRRPGAAAQTASDKIFGEKPFATPRIHAAS